MKWLRVLGAVCLVSSFAVACAKGRDVKSASGDDDLGFDEDGLGRKCENPRSNCEEVTEPSLDFRQHCREAGFRMRQCGCDNLCTGNINGDRTGFTPKNDLKPCKPRQDNCEMANTSAAFQDACDQVGGDMLDCGCEWLCSKELKEPIPEPAKDDDAAKPDDGTADDGAGAASESGEDKTEAPKPRTNLDGKTPEAPAQDTEQPGKRKKTGRFFDPE